MTLEELSHLCASTLIFVPNDMARDITPGISFTWLCALDGSYVREQPDEGPITRRWGRGRSKLGAARAYARLLRNKVLMFIDNSDEVRAARTNSVYYRWRVYPVPDTLTAGRIEV